MIWLYDDNRRWLYDDGGRRAAGFKGRADDCVCRALAIAMQRPYIAVYHDLNQAGRAERRRNKEHRSSARTGVYTPTIRRYMAAQGWRWTATMLIGQGCKVHLRRDELPSGRLIVSLSRHVSAVIDGIVYDTHDPCRDGTRCVYGYWEAE